MGFCGLGFRRLARCLLKVYITPISHPVASAIPNINLLGLSLDLLGTSREYGKILCKDDIGSIFRSFLTTKLLWLLLFCLLLLLVIFSIMCITSSNMITSSSSSSGRKWYDVNLHIYIYICSPPPPPRTTFWAKNCLSHGPIGKGKIPSINMNIGNGLLLILVFVSI